MFINCPNVSIAMEAAKPIMGLNARIAMEAVLKGRNPPYGKTKSCHFL